MPIVHLEIMEGRPEEKIKKAIQDITHTVCESLEVPKERVRVIVTEVPKTHWGIGGVPVSEMKNR